MPAMNLRADIIIPVYNERDNLPGLLERLRALPDASMLNLIFVDNASTDGSTAFLQNIPGATLVRHTHNQGYGASLRSGIGAAKTDRIVIIDADGEYPPECIPQLVDALDAHDVVYASRLLGRKTATQAGMSPFKWLGNRVISGAYNFLFSQKVTDLYTGCKALKRDCLQNVRFQRSGFEQVLEMAAKLSVAGYSIAEIPVAFTARSHGLSKMSHISETLKYFFWLIFFKIKLSGSQETVRGDRQ